MSWTDDRVVTLTKLWHDGHSASAIAQKLGDTTRNAVIGKMHRLGLAGRVCSSRARPRARPLSPFAGLQKPRKSRVRTTARAFATRPKARPALPALSELEPLSGPPVTIETLTAKCCRWPFGDPKTSGFRFCGHAKQTHGPYCDHHAAIAFR